VPTSYSRIKTHDLRADDTTSASTELIVKLDSLAVSERAAIRLARSNGHRPTGERIEGPSKVRLGESIKIMFALNDPRNHLRRLRRRGLEPRGFVSGFRHSHLLGFDARIPVGSCDRWAQASVHALGRQFHRRYD